MTKDSLLKTILVTGGCGFIGTNLVKYLSQVGYKVRVLDSLSTSSTMWTADHRPLTTRQKGQQPIDSRLSTVDLVVGDIRDREAVESTVEGVDGVVHLAAHTSVVESLENPEEDWDINVNGTVNLLEACRHHGVERFIFASSNAAVGEQTPPIDESKVPRPFSPYGASKLAGEALCSAYYHSFGSKTISLRFANCYGPYSDHKSSVIATFMRRAKEGEPFIIYGDGNQTRDFVHVDDVCQAICLSLAAPDCGQQTLDLFGEVFQIASGVETSINELAEMMKEVTESKPQIMHEPERHGEIKRNYSNLGKAMTLLGFKPKIELRKRLHDLWHWYVAS